MKLLTHNFLTCNVKSCIESLTKDPSSEKKNYPLKIVCTPDDIQVETIEQNPKFLKNMLGKVNYIALKFAAQCIGISDLPDTLPSDADSNESFLTLFHHALLEVQVNKGILVCEHCGREYGIVNGIPNFLLHEDEI